MAERKIQSERSQQQGWLVRWIRRELDTPALRLTGSLVFCALLSVVVFRTLLVQNTNWTEETLQWAVTGNQWAERAMVILCVVLLALQLVRDWIRALVAGIALLL